MSERYNYEQEQLNIQVQCDPTTILHRKVAKNVKTQVHRSELAPVDVCFELNLSRLYVIIIPFRKRIKRKCHEMNQHRMNVVPRN